ncbi:unnamed protein product [Urochloa humidicola]
MVRRASCAQIRPVSDWDAPAGAWIRRARRRSAGPARRAVESSCRGLRLQLPRCAVPRMDVPTSPRGQLPEDAHRGTVATARRGASRPGRMPLALRSHQVEEMPRAPAH